MEIDTRKKEKRKKRESRKSSKYNNPNTKNDKKKELKEHFLTDKEKIDERSEVDTYFGKSMLWSSNSSFSRTSNGHLPPFLDAIKRGDIGQIQKLWDEVIIGDVKTFTHPSPDVELRNSQEISRDGSFTDDNEIPNNAFHIAAYYNQPDSIEFLVDAVKTSMESKDYLLILHARNKEGKTPLHIAAYLQNPKCMENLVKVDGLNLDIHDNNQVTPLHIASFYGNDQVGTLSFSNSLF